MNPTPVLNEFDPDFEEPANLLPRRSRSVLRPRRREDWEFQVALVNPFLLPAVCVLWQLLATSLLRTRPETAFPLVVVGVTACLLATPLLFRFHCLDCGRTYPIRGWRAHACVGLLDRVRSRKERRLKIPSVGLQIALWRWLIYPLAFLSICHALVQLAGDSVAAR